MMVCLDFTLEFWAAKNTQRCFWVQRSRATSPGPQVWILTIWRSELYNMKIKKVKLQLKPISAKNHNWSYLKQKQK